MENVIQHCNTGNIPSANTAQDSVESITDFLSRKMNGCDRKQLKDKEEEQDNIYSVLLSRYLPPASLPVNTGKNGTTPEMTSASGLQVVPENFWGKEQFRASLRKQVTEKDIGGRYYSGATQTSAGTGNEESVRIPEMDTGITSTGKMKVEKKTNAEATNTFASESPLFLHTVSMSSGKSPVSLIQFRTETPAPERQLQLPGQTTPEMTEKGDAVIYRFQRWNRDASVSIQPQSGGVMVLQPSDRGVEQQLVTHWPTEQEPLWYLFSDEHGKQKYHQERSDDAEEET